MELLLIKSIPASFSVCLGIEHKSKLRRHSLSGAMWVAVKGRDLGCPIPGCWSWLLKHAMLPLWWGKNQSLCKRFRDTSLISQPSFNAEYGYWNQSSWKGLDSFPCWICPRWEADRRCRLMNSSPVFCKYVGIYSGDLKGCFPVPLLLGKDPDCSFWVCTK